MVSLRFFFVSDYWKRFRNLTYPNLLINIDFSYCTPNSNTVSVNYGGMRWMPDPRADNKFLTLSFGSLSGLPASRLTFSLD